MNTKSKMLLTSVSITFTVILLVVVVVVVVVVCPGGVCSTPVCADNGQTGRNHTVSAAGEVRARPHDKLDNAQKQQIKQNMDK